MMWWQLLLALYVVVAATLQVTATTSKDAPAPVSPESIKVQALERQSVPCVRHEKCFQYRKSPSHWWTYEWCPGRHLVQFHGEGRDSETLIGSPLTFMVRDGGAASVYGDGAWCVEGNAPRQAAIRFHCCGESALAQRPRLKLPSNETSFLLAVNEPKACQYVADVCAQCLCDPMSTCESGLWRR